MGLAQSLSARHTRLFVVIVAILIIGAAVINEIRGPNSRAGQVERRATSLLRAQRRDFLVQEGPAWVRRGLQQIFARLNMSADQRTRDEELVALGPAAIPHLTRVLSTDRNPQMRSFAAFVLQEFDDDRTFAALTNALAHERDEMVLSGIVDALARSDATATVPAFAAAYNRTTNNQIRCEVLFGLGGFRGSLALDLLTNALTTSTNEEIRVAALRGLGQLGAVVAFTSISNALRTDPDVSVRTAAAAVLAPLDLLEKFRCCLK
jgi:HEAT repeat protein